MGGTYQRLTQNIFTQNVDSTDRLYAHLDPHHFFGKGALEPFHFPPLEISFSPRGGIEPKFTRTKNFMHSRSVSLSQNFHQQKISSECNTLPSDKSDDVTAERTLVTSENVG